MAVATRPSSLRHPERIHPALWRATQFSRARHSSIPSGFNQLNQALPDRGWPLGSLIEMLPAQPGIGEISLLSPALAQLDSQRSIVLINPPYQPYFHCWRNWQLQQHRLLWIKPRSCIDTLWAAEQALRHNACAAVICWADPIRLTALRRLHLAAQQTDTLLFLLRPQTATQQASASPLRLLLQPRPGGLEVFIIKRRGPCSTEPLLITFSFSRASQGIAPHVALDQPVLARTQAGHLYSAASSQ